MLDCLADTNNPAELERLARMAENRAKMAALHSATDDLAAQKQRKIVQS